MRKVAIIGAGNVGGQIAMLLIKEAVPEILLLDIAKGLAKGKALDLEDFSSLQMQNCAIEGSDDFTLLKDANIVVITAGLARKPGMSREDLLKINSEIVKDVSLKIRKFSANPIVIVVTNPVDLMTHLVYKTTGFQAKRVLGMGISLDAGRLANLIKQELNVPIESIAPLVIGSHGQGMVPSAHLSQVSGLSLEKMVDKTALSRLTEGTIERGASIVAHLGSGSAYFGPACAAVNIIKSILKDEKRIVGACVFLNGEYGIKDLYLGVPARIGKDGVEKILELELNKEEKEAFLKSAESIRGQIKQLVI